MKVWTSPSLVSGSSAVPKAQPVGSLTLGCSVMFRDQWPAGYSSIFSHWMFSISGVMVIRPWAPAVGDRCCIRATISVAPAGTSMWKAKGCRVSRTHSTRWPFAVISSPASWAIGPTGPWLPGSHSGKNSVIGPVCATGIVSVTSKMCWLRFVASTSSRITPG